MAGSAINAQFVRDGAGGAQRRRALAERIPALGRFDRHQVAGQQYVTDPNNSRRVAHIIVGCGFLAHHRRKGLFRFARRLYRRNRAGGKRRKRLAVMDQDGANVRYLTRGDDLVVTPRFSPSSQDVTYMSFGDVDPHVLLLNIETGQREVGRQFSGHDLFAALLARWTEDRDVACARLVVATSIRWICARARRREFRIHRRSTHRRPFRPTDRRSFSNPIAAARSRSM